jgi:2-methylcitrate dehydratase PrpD
MALVEILSSFAHDLKYSDLSDQLVSNAKLHILDGIGVGLHASTLNLFQPVLKILKAMGGEGAASVFGSKFGFPAPYAAFANGVMLNSSAYQPTHRSSLAHPHAPVLSAALAVGEERSANGNDFLTTVVAAYEIYLRLCAAVSPSQLGRGIQTTGAMAPFAAAVAAGKLIGLNKCQMKHALSHAANFSGAGLIEAHGAKPYFAIQVGPNVWKGVLAAMLAQEGVTGCDTILEGGSVSQKAFLHAYSDEYNLKVLTEGLGEEFEILQTGFGMNCVASFSRTPIDATLAVVKENEIKINDIKELKVKVTKVLYNFVQQRITTARESAREAYYYIPFSIALALLNGRVDSEMYNDENLNNPEIQKIMKKVQFTQDPQLDSDYVQSKSVMTSIVELTTDDGRTYTKKLNYAKGDPENLPTKEELEDKFTRLATKVVTKATADKIIDLVDHLENVRDIRCLGGFIRPA